MMNKGKPVWFTEEDNKVNRADIVFVRWYDSPETTAAAR